jgi:hypothetical protein
MDCDTTGIEPDLALVKTKKLVGGGSMSIVNQTVPRALRRLGYADEQIEQIEAYVNEHATIVGAPELAAEHRALWRKGAAEPGGAAALCRLAIDRLEGLALVRRCGDGVVALPALARFAYASPVVGDGPGGRA